MAKKKSAKPGKSARRPAMGHGKGKSTGGRPISRPRQNDPHADFDDSSTGDDQHVPPAFTLVGIGASAGGLEALSLLLSALPANPELAVIIVQHLAPKHESVLPHLLAESSRLPVAEVTDGMRVEPNHVYVVPPNKEMGIANGRLRLMPRPSNASQFNPIDFFMRTLAEYARTRAIGVILSGTASDGAIGLREIKGAGGIAIAQDPKTARFDGMPRAAIATGIIDRILSPADIARELAQIGRHLKSISPRQSEDGAIHFPNPAIGPDASQLSRIYALLRKASGVDFTHYKLPTLRRRLHRRMVLHKISTVEQYIRFIEKNPAEVLDFYQDILIHVTRFFREADSFKALETSVFPSIIEQAKKGNALRIWIPGCSTGEEVYSVAISLLEHLGDDASDTLVQIFGTDVSEKAIEQARAGMYPESITADVSAPRLRRFFNRVDGNYRINKNVRDLCIFARQDVTRDPPFSKLDLIICRNLLIYLDAVLQKKLMQVFHYALRPKGFLMLGVAETIGSNSDLFTVAEKKHKIYTKKLAAASRPEMDFTPHDHGMLLGGSRKLPLESVRPSGNVLQEANRVILSRYAPPGVVIDNDLRIVQFRGQTGDYLQPAPGEASLNLLKMARDGLLYGLRTGIHEARKTDAIARKAGLRVEVAGHFREVDLEIVPLSSIEGKHFLILFHDRSATATTDDAAVSAAAKKDRQRAAKPGNAPTPQAEGQLQLSQLRQELAASREYLQLIIQDKEAANEELQSANEEILSSNEELQSTNEELDTAKEELQSTNEELNTVNEELQGRNEELSRVNSDLVNLLGSVQIAIVMVASDLRIRRFTPMAEKVLNLIPSDIGRPISDINPNIDCPDLERLITEAVDNVTIKECEARDRNGNWYLLRIRPYKNLENRIDGAVVALFDIDASRRQGADGVVAPEAIGALIEVSHEPMAVLDSKHVCRAANIAFLKEMGSENIVGRSILEIANGQWNMAELRRAVENASAVPRDGKAPAGKGDRSAKKGKESIRACRQMIGGEELTLVVFDRDVALAKTSGKT